MGTSARHAGSQALGGFCFSGIKAYNGFLRGRGREAQLVALVGDWPGAYFTRERTSPLITIGQLLLHVGLALIAFLVVLNGYLLGARKQSIDVLLSVSWAALLLIALLVFGWKASIVAFTFSFIYGWVLRAAAAALALRLTGYRLIESTPARREPIWLNPWIACTVAIGWLVEQGGWPLSIVDELLLAIVPVAIVWRRAWRARLHQGRFRAFALSVIGAGIATEGLLTLGRLIHSLVRQVAGLRSIWVVILFTGFAGLLLVLTVGLARAGFWMFWRVAFDAGSGHETRVRHN